MRAWLWGRRGDMVWNALVVVAVLLPLASLTIDVPRYFTLRSRLQLAVDAAAEAAARCVDMRHFQNAGDARLRTGCVQQEANRFFALSTEDLVAKGHAPALGAVTVDENQDTVRAEASGTTRIFFNLTPEFAVQVHAMSSFRMDKR